MESMKLIIEKQKNEFFTYFVVMLIFQMGSLYSRILHDDNFLLNVVWYMVYFGLHIYIGFSSKTWKQTAGWLFVSPLFSVVILFGNSEVDPLVFFITIVSLYVLSWIIVALYLEKKQYQCATSFIMALMTTFIGMYGFFVFYEFILANINLKFGELTLEIIGKIITIAGSIIFIAEKWGKFILDWKEAKGGASNICGENMQECLFK